MKTITRDYKYMHYDGEVFGRYFGDLKPCVLDIETTGLSASTGRVILIGLLTETDSGLSVTQFLAEDPYEEDRVLDAALDFIEREQIGYLLTYNGLRFDIPFIERRLAAVRSERRIRLYHFDLYRFLRRHSVLPNLIGSLNQKNVEAYYGIGSDRKDTISGKESVAMYEEYAVTGSGTLEKIILTHNREDVIQLYRLLCAAGADDFRLTLKYSFHKAICEYGFPIKDSRGKAVLTARPNFAGKTPAICGDQIADPVSAAFFPDFDLPFTTVFRADNSFYSISIPPECIRLSDDSDFEEINRLAADIVACEYARALQQQSANT